MMSVIAFVRKDIWKQLYNQYKAELSGSDLTKWTSFGIELDQAVIDKIGEFVSSNSSKNHKFFRVTKKGVAVSPIVPLNNQGQPVNNVGVVPGNQMNPQNIYGIGVGNQGQGQDVQMAGVGNQNQVMNQLGGGNANQIQVMNNVKPGNGNLENALSPIIQDLHHEGKFNNIMNENDTRSKTQIYDDDEEDI